MRNGTKILSLSHENFFLAESYQRKPRVSLLGTYTTGN